MAKPKTLRLILGDQLNAKHSWFKQKNENIIYTLMEVRTETDYAWHHIQKVVGFFAAMRGFAKALEQAGHRVVYFSLDAENNQQTFEGNLKQLIQNFGIVKFEYQLPDEYRVDETLKTFCNTLNIASEAFDTEHFYTSRFELKDMFSGKKQVLMETFYRAMRKKHHVLMAGEKPITGKWNYDADNRKKLPENVKVPAPMLFSHDVSEIVSTIEKAGVKTIGKINPNSFEWPINRKESLELLAYFIEHFLSRFGDYQDAMHRDEWSLFHSRLSFSLNTKMISPKEVVDAAIHQWLKNQDQIEFSQIEGFVRQIIGWREYMRGIYWWKMPEFASQNFFENTASLPDWYWTGNTKMACMKSAITQSLEHAYAHHIQRLMITGNFALLAGVHPDHVDAWYLSIYIDALDWVEITNTRGMSQFADGGFIATKPYVSSAAYIHKMSHYCDKCHYNFKVKTGEKACPFNSLYWNFYDRNRSKLEGNPRIGMMYKIWDKMNLATKTEYILQAEKYLSEVNYI